MEKIYKGFISYTPAVANTTNKADIVTADTLDDLRKEADEMTEMKAKLRGWKGTATVAVYWHSRRCELYDFVILGFAE